MIKSSGICIITSILKSSAILLGGMLLAGMIYENHNHGPDRHSLYPYSQYLFCDAQGGEEFEIYSPWFHPLDEEMVDRFYHDPPLVKFFLIDLRDCEFFYETLRYSRKDLRKIDPRGEVYDLCADFAAKLRPKKNRLSFGFLSNIAKLFREKET